jgi:predicted esterase
MFRRRLISAVTVLASWCSLIGVGALAVAPSPAQLAASNAVRSAPTELVGPVIPKPTGTCPRFTNGRATFAPAGIAPRKVLLFTGKRVGGPLVIYWHGMGGRPEEALSGLSRKVIKQITDQGGVVAAPTHDPASTPYPWYLVSTKREDDLILTDEIVGCAHKIKHIDPEHIHALGMSAGGLQATQLGPRRSNYMASIVAYSGGLVVRDLTPPFQAPDNKFPALLFHGGSGDEYIVNFQRTTRDYAALLRDNGHKAIVCDHKGGHVIPRGGGAAAYRFFADHPFRLPRSQPELLEEPLDYCGLVNQRPNQRSASAPR